jgi:hypothetical protein
MVEPRSALCHERAPGCALEDIGTARRSLVTSMPDLKNGTKRAERFLREPIGIEIAPGSMNAL